MQDDKNPMTWDLDTWIFSLCVGAVGGFLNLLLKIKSGATSLNNVCITILDLIISMVVGAMVTMLVMGLGYSVGVSAAIGSYVAHRATRFLLTADKILDVELEKLTKRFNDESK